MEHDNYSYPSVRDERNERFTSEEGWLPLFEKKLGSNISYDAKKYCYTIIGTQYGTIDFYPKANKLLIRKENNWKKPALRWLIENILNKD